MIPEHLISNRMLGIDTAVLQSDAIAQGDAYLTEARIAWLRDKLMPRAQTYFSNLLYNTLEKPELKSDQPYFVKQ